MKKTGSGWAKAAKILATGNDRFKRAMKTSLMREAHFLRGHMVKGIASGAPGGRAFAPLSPITLAMRKFRGFGGTKPLNASGGLRKAISVVHERGGTGAGGRVFVGVHRTATRSGAARGKSLLDIAEIQEFGRSWRQRLSARARRFLFMVIGRHGGKTMLGPVERDTKGRFRRGRRLRPKSATGGVISIHIPPRPFISPVLSAHAKPEAVRKRFAFNMANALGGDFGTPT